MNHHRMFTHIRHSDHALMILNLLLLFGVCVVPFPTAVLAAHLGHSDSGRRRFSITPPMCWWLCFNLLWRYAASKNRRLLGAEASQSAVERITGQSALGPVAYLVCLGLAFVNVTASIVLNGALAFFALPPSVAWRAKE